MRRDYEGKIGIGQTFFCLLVAATLLIPFAISTMSFAAFNIMPIGDSLLSNTQSLYVTAFFTTLSAADKIPDFVYTATPYVLYVFYGLEGLTLFLTIIMFFWKNEAVRIILRTLSILASFVMMAVFFINLLTVAGFFTYFFSGGFGEDALIVDCMMEQGLFFFLGVTFLSALSAIKHLTSFFGKSY